MGKMLLSKILRRHATETDYPHAYKWAERAAEMEAANPTRDAWVAERKRFLLELEAEKRRIKRHADEVKQEALTLGMERARLSAVAAKLKAQEAKLKAREEEQEKREALFDDKLCADMPAAILAKVEKKTPGRLPEGNYTPYVKMPAPQGIDRIHRSSRQ